MKVAQAITGERNDTKAIEKFRSQLQSDKYFYTIENESKYSEPYMRCYDDETAQEYCPERWKAMQRWLQSAETVSRTNVDWVERNHSQPHSHLYLVCCSEHQDAEGESSVSVLRGK